MSLPRTAAEQFTAYTRVTFNQLRPGDLITLETPIGPCTYSVSGPAVVVLPDGKLPNGRSVVDNNPGQHTLTLTKTGGTYLVIDRFDVR